MAIAFCDGEIPATRGGLDWIQLAEWVGIRREQDWRWFWSVLEKTKAAAAEGGQPVVVNVGPFRCVVNGWGEQRFEYSLTVGSWRVFCSARDTGRESSLPNFKVVVSGFDLLNNPPDALVKQWRDFVEEIGGEIRRETVSRVDLAVDVGVSVGYWVEAFNEGRIVTRADKLTPYVKVKGREVETLWFGRGELQLRVYDKPAELRARGEGEAVKAIAERVGPYFSRCEFQLRREVLGKKFGVEDYNSLVERGRRIAGYCARDWFRFTELPNAGNNRRRLGYDPAWREVADTLEWCFSEEAREASIDPAKTRCDLAPLLSQVLGLVCRVVGQGSDQLRKGLKEVLLEGLALASEHVQTLDKEKQAQFFQKYFVAYELQQIRRGMAAKTPDLDAVKRAFARDGFEVEHLLPNGAGGLKEDLMDFDEFLRRFG